MEKKKNASDAVSGSGQYPQQEEERVKLFTANPDFLLREIGGEAVLVPVGEAGVFENSVISLNDTCRFLWQQFQTPRSVEDVIAAAKEEYDDPDGVMEQGIHQFVKEYLQYGLLKEEERKRKRKYGRTR